MKAEKTIMKVMSQKVWPENAPPAAEARNVGIPMKLFSVPC
jgi:hypothetical protein